jgi:hypothetical protein
MVTTPQMRTLGRIGLNVSAPGDRAMGREVGGPGDHRANLLWSPRRRRTGHDARSVHPGDVAIRGHQPIEGDADVLRHLSIPPPTHHRPQERAHESGKSGVLEDESRSAGHRRERP